MITKRILTLSILSIFAATPVFAFSKIAVKDYSTNTLCAKIKRLNTHAALSMTTQNTSSDQILLAKRRPNKVRRGGNKVRKQGNYVKRYFPPKNPNLVRNRGNKVETRSNNRRYTKFYAGN